MFGADLTIPILLIYLLQVLILPVQIVSYFLKRQDKGRLRILILSIVFLIYNSVSILRTVYDSLYVITEFLEVSVVVYAGYCILVRDGIKLRKIGFFHQVLSFILLTLLKKVGEEIFIDLQWCFDWGFIIGCEIILMLILWRLYSVKKESGLNALSNLQVILFSVGFLLPVLLQVTMEKNLHVVLQNLVFFILSFDYLRDYIHQSNMLETEKNEEPRLFRDANLTDRQKEICLLLMEGLEPKEITQVLPISHDTVRSHLSNIYRKTGVKGLSNLKKELLR